MCSSKVILAVATLTNAQPLDVIRAHQDAMRDMAESPEMWRDRASRRPGASVRLERLRIRHLDELTPDDLTPERELRVQPRSSCCRSKGPRGSINIAM